DLLPEPLRQPLGRQARNCVGGAASGIAHQQVHRSRWIAFLRPCDPRGRERGSTRCETQKLPAANPHNVHCLIRPHRTRGPNRKADVCAMTFPLWVRCTSTLISLEPPQTERIRGKAEDE